MTWTFKDYLGSRFVIRQADMSRGQDTYFFARREAARVLGVPIEELIFVAEES